MTLLDGPCAKQLVCEPRHDGAAHCGPHSIVSAIATAVFCCGSCCSCSTAPDMCQHRCRRRGSCSAGGHSPAAGPSFVAIGCNTNHNGAPRRPAEPRYQTNWLHGTHNWPFSGHMCRAHPVGVHQPPPSPSSRGGRMPVERPRRRRLSSVRRLARSASRPRVTLAGPDQSSATQPIVSPPSISLTLPPPLAVTR